MLEEALSRRSAVPRRDLVIATTKQGAGHYGLDDAEAAVSLLRSAGGIITATIGGMPFYSTKAARSKEYDVLRKAAKGDITLHRIKHGQPYTPKEGETVLHNPTLDHLAAMSQLPGKITVTYPYRDYRKADRGNPNVWLEDVGGLYTGQQRPVPAWRQKVSRVIGKIGEKTKRHLERLRRQSVTRELTNGRERQADRGQERGVGI